MRVATCGLGTRRCARVASAGAMKISGLTVIVTCERVINLSPNAGRFALVEPIVGAMRHVPGGVGRRPRPSPQRSRPKSQDEREPSEATLLREKPTGSR